MSNAKFFLSGRTPFTGISAAYEKSEYVFFGVPYDKTSTYRAGSRFAPGSIRDVSSNLELYSIRSALDLEQVPIHDMGDVDVVEDLGETLRRVHAIISEIVATKRLPLMVGGEHSITKAAVESLPKETGVVSFDAHMDLRDEFLGAKLSHATFMRRLAEYLGPSHIMEIGIRAFSKPELDFCEKDDVTVVTPLDIRKDGTEKIGARVRSFLSQFRHAYVTVDIDVLDPAFAPGVGNPEPDGLSTDELLTLLSASMIGNMSGFDLVEVCPPLDSGQTASVGAKVILEAVAAHYSRSQGR